MTPDTKQEDFLLSIQKDPLYWAERVKTNLTEEIARLMEEQKVSKKQLAEKLGTSQSYITKVLNENVNFTIESMSKIAFALGCKIDVSMTPVVCFEDRPKPKQEKDRKTGLDVKVPLYAGCGQNGEECLYTRVASPDDSLMRD